MRSSPDEGQEEDPAGQGAHHPPPHLLIGPLLLDDLPQLRLQVVAGPPENPEAEPGVVLPAALHQPVGGVRHCQRREPEQEARQELEPGHGPPREEQVARDVGEEAAEGEHVADDGAEAASEEEENK